MFRKRSGCLVNGRGPWGPEQQDSASILRLVLSSCKYVDLNNRAENPTAFAANSPAERVRRPAEDEFIEDLGVLVQVNACWSKTEARPVLGPGACVDDAMADLIALLNLRWQCAAAKSLRDFVQGGAYGWDVCRSGLICVDGVESASGLVLVSANGMLAALTFSSRTDKLSKDQSN